MTSKGKSPAVQVIGVKKIPTDQLHPNPHNPRLLFDRQDMHVLRESINRVGILVPLTVYKESSSGNYRILDGQRRWMCATALRLKTVPVNEVAEPSLVANIVTMFQIHRLRKDWELMPTALKLELLMDEIGDKNARRIAELTAVDEAQVVRCKKLLTYDRPYQDMMLHPDPAARVKADFFIELYAVRNDRVVNSFEWYEKDSFTDAMLKKFEAGGLKAVTDFRIVKQHINNAVKAGKLPAISRRLREFVADPKLTPRHLEIASVRTASGARKLVASAEKLFTAIEGIDTEEYYGENAMWAKLEALADLIRRKLRALGRRLEK